MVGNVIVFGGAFLVAGGLWLTGKIWGANSMPQKIYTALVLIGITAFFVSRWFRPTVNPNGRVIAVYPLADERVAVLRERLVNTRVRKLGESSSAADFRREWILQTTGGKPVELFNADNLLVTPAWHFRGTHDRLWIYTGKVLLLTSLQDGTITHTQQSLGAAQPVFLPPFELHEHPFDVRTRQIIVRDREDRWWKVAGDLSVQKTKNAEAEFDWRGYEDDLKLGCYSKRKYYEPSTGRSRVRLTELKAPMSGRGPDKDPEGNVLDATMLRDMQHHCTIDTKDGAIVVHRQNLSAQSEVLLSLAANKDGELRWTSPLGATCGTGRQLPIQSRENEGTLVLMFAGGTACAINSTDGKRVWTADVLARDPPVDRKAAKWLEVEWKGGTMEPWIALESGALVHAKVELSTGKIVASTFTP